MKYLLSLLLCYMCLPALAQRYAAYKPENRHAVGVDAMCVWQGFTAYEAFGWGGTFSYRYCVTDNFRVGADATAWTDVYDGFIMYGLHVDAPITVSETLKIGPGFGINKELAGQFVPSGNISVLYSLGEHVEFNLQPSCIYFMEDGDFMVPVHLGVRILF